MKQIFLGLCLIFLAGNAFAQGNQGYMQHTQPAAAQSSQTSTSAGNQTIGPLDANKTGFESTPLNKFGRGVVNVATCWLEIPATAEREAKAKHSEVYGATVGVMGGIFMTLARAFTGLCDVLTFPFSPYDKPMMEPAYAYDSFMQADAHTTITE